MHALYRNHMGNDLEVVQDARISFAASSEAVSWELKEIPNRCDSAANTTANIPTLGKGDEGLIQFLARGCKSGDWRDAITGLTEFSTREEIHELLMWAKRIPTHWTPFGQQTIKLRMKAPVPIRTQCFKSKIGFVENEESRRYISSTPELFIPEFRMAPESDIKQGSGGVHPQNSVWQQRYSVTCDRAILRFEEMIEAGVAPEQARFILPQGCYVNWVWTGSLYAYAEFCNKRKDGHAQGEIQQLANAIDPIMDTLFPVSWAALTK